MAAVQLVDQLQQTNGDFSTGAYTGRKVGHVLADLWNERSYWYAKADGSQDSGLISKPAADSRLAQLFDQLDAIEGYLVVLMGGMDTLIQDPEDNPPDSHIVRSVRYAIDNPS